MFSLFFKSGAKLLRICVEAANTVPPHVAVAANAIYDHTKNVWLKSSFDSAAVVPDALKAEVDHTFFTFLGFCWFVIGDFRFKQTFRINCSRYCEMNALINLDNFEAAYQVLSLFFRNSCYSGQWVEKRFLPDERNTEYNLFPI